MSDAPLDVPALEKLLSMLADREDQAAHRHREARHLTEPWDQLRLAYFTNNAVEREQQAIALRALGARLSELVRDGERLDWMGDHYARFVSGSWRGNRPIGDEDVTIEWVSFDNDSYGEPMLTTARPDFRAAIDAARSPALAAPEKTP